MSTEEKQPSPSSSSSAIEKDRSVAGEGEIKELPAGDTVTKDEIDEKKLVRKIDLALIPWLSFLYLIGEFNSFLLLFYGDS